MIKCNLFIAICLVAFLVPGAAGSDFTDAVASTLARTFTFDNLLRHRIECAFVCFIIVYAVLALAGANTNKQITASWLRWEPKPMCSRPSMAESVQQRALAYLRLRSVTAGHIIDMSLPLYTCCCCRGAIMYADKIVHITTRQLPRRLSRCRLALRSCSTGS